MSTFRNRAKALALAPSTWLAAIAESTLIAVTVTSPSPRLAGLTLGVGSAAVALLAYRGVCDTLDRLIDAEASARFDAEVRQITAEHNAWRAGEVGK